MGDDPGYNSDVVESNLDIEWANAVAPGAQIVYVYSLDVFDAAQFAVDDNVAPILSLSFGGCEAYNRIGYRSVAQQASAQGITWLAASGDTGRRGVRSYVVDPQAAKGLAVGFPASIPEITSVGGTQFDDANGEVLEQHQHRQRRVGIGLHSGGRLERYAVPERLQRGRRRRQQSLPEALLADGTGRAGRQYTVRSGCFAGGFAQQCGLPGFRLRRRSIRSAAPRPRRHPWREWWHCSINISVRNPACLRPDWGISIPLSTAWPNPPPKLSTTSLTGDNAVRCALGTPNCVEGFIGYRAGPGYDLATGLGTIDAYNLVTKWNTGTASTTVVTADPPKAGLTDTVTLTAIVSGGTSGSGAQRNGLIPGGERGGSRDRQRRIEARWDQLDRDTRGARHVGDRRQRRGNGGLQRRQGCTTHLRRR